jgi:hypothetical protein
MAEVGLLPFCARGAASGHAGFTALPQAFQQTSIPQPQLLAAGAMGR